MPFTPFHLGPGALFKALGGKRFSFMVFGGAQVLMDIEPLVAMSRGSATIHGASHTILGALGVGLVAGVLGKPASERVLRWAAITHAPLTWRVSFLSALVGTSSHVILDSIMHRDMTPLWPLAAGNPLLDAIPVATLHILCIVCGGMGVAILSRGIIMQLFRR